MKLQFYKLGKCRLIGSKSRGQDRKIFFVSKNLLETQNKGGIVKKLKLFFIDKLATIVAILGDCFDLLSEKSLTLLNKLMKQYIKLENEIYGGGE